MDEDESITLAQIETNASLNLTTTSVASDELSKLNSYEFKKEINKIFELDNDELAKIEEHIRMKILRNASNFMHKYDCLRADNEKIKVEYEQYFKELETNYFEAQAKFDAEMKNAHIHQSRAIENGK